MLTTVSLNQVELKVISAHRLFVWNWLPARYASPACWASLGVRPRPAANSRDERWLSRWLLNEYGLISDWQTSLPSENWLFAPASALSALQLKLGLAACAHAVSQMLSRQTIRAFQQQFGEAHYSTALALADGYPHLAGLRANWNDLSGMDELKGLGAGLLMAYLAGAEPDARSRFALRMADITPILPTLDHAVRDDLTALLEAEDCGADPAFEWFLPMGLK